MYVVVLVIVGFVGGIVEVFMFIVLYVVFDWLVGYGLVVY